MSVEFTLENLIKEEIKDLFNLARELEIEDYANMSKKELVLAIIRNQKEKQGFYTVEGVLDVNANDTNVFLRPINYSPSNQDIYISQSQIRRFELRNGDYITGPARAPKENERYAGLMQISTVNGLAPEEVINRDAFAGLTPLYPDEKIQLEYRREAISNRMIDVIAPVGFGQRGLIVSPPKAGKTTIIKEIAKGISSNYPEAKLMVLLIDERPEEVTDMERTINGEVISSTFDQSPENHTRISELVLARAQRMVEMGEDVIILLDSITRLARAYNLVVRPSGRTLSGGLDPASLYSPKHFFGAARNIENGGSLTILATVLVDTGSRMDDMVYEEFKGTGNMEVHLSRSLAERRIFPAIDMQQSGTRREELLMPADHLSMVWNLRKMISANPLEYTEQLVNMLKQTSDNEMFFERLRKFVK